MNLLMVEHQVKAFQLKGKAQIVRRTPISINIDSVGAKIFHGSTSIIFPAIQQISVIALTVGKMTDLPIGFVDRGPCGDIDIHILCACQKVGPMGVIRAIAITGLDTIDITTTLGDDVHNSRKGHVTIQG